MSYDPLSQYNAQPSQGLSGPASFPSPAPDMSFGPRQASFNQGQLTPQQLMPPPSQSPYDLAQIGQGGVGKFNLGLNEPAPWVAPNVNPNVGPTQPPIRLEPGQGGLFETTLRGLENLFVGTPLQFTPLNTTDILGNTLNGHINNLFGMIGKIADIPLGLIKPIQELPSGQDVTQAYNLMPDDSQKAAYNAAIASDPINREHYMAQYLRAFEKDYASTTGRSRLMSGFDLPSESLGEQLGRIVFGALSAQGLSVARTYVGSAYRNVQGTVINADPNTLPADLQYMRQQYLDGKTSYNDLLDDITTSRWAWTQDPGLFGTVANLGMSILTDPLTWETLGVGKAAGLAASGAAMGRGVEAFRLLEKEDPAAAAAYQASSAFHGHQALPDLARSMETTHPDLMKQVDAMDHWAGRKVNATSHAMVALQPMLGTAEAVVNKLVNPLGWFGPAGDHIAGMFSQRMARQGMDGVVNAMGASHLRAIASLAKDNTTDLTNALGTYVSNIVNALHQRNLTREVIRSGEVGFKDEPNRVILERNQIPTVASEAYDAHQSAAHEWLPRARVGKAAVEANLAEGRRLATLWLEDITHATPEAVAKLVNGRDEDFLSTAHALNYGRVVEGFGHVKTALVDRAQKALDALPTGDPGIEDARGVLTYMKRLTVIGERELTVARANELLKAIDGPGGINAARLAIERFDIIAHNFRGSEVTDDALLPQMRLLLKQLLDETKGSRLVHSIRSSELEEPMRSFFEREAARYGDSAYVAGLAPEDVWGVVRDPSTDKIIGAHPWVDVVGNNHKPWLPSRMDRVRMGLFTPIRGNRMLMEARRNFVKMGVERGLTAGEGEHLFGLLRNESARRLVGPRGLTTETVGQIAAEAKIPDGVRLRIGERGLTWMLAKAWEGELATVGATSKLSGMLKTKFAARGNFIGRVAEEFYPRARFYLSPNFMFQEWIEGPFFDIIRGVKPGFRGKYNDHDFELLHLLDNINTHERYADQYEYIFFQRVLQGEARANAGPGTRLNFLTRKLDGINGISQQKHLNYARQWGHEAGLAFEEAINRMQPGLYNEMRAHYGATNKTDIMLAYFKERGLGRGEDARLGAHMQDASKPPDLGRGFYPLMGDVARDHGYTSAQALREDVRAGRYSETQFTDVMRSYAHPEYIKEAWLRAQRPSAAEFRSTLITELRNTGLSKAHATLGANKSMDFYRAAADVAGVPVDEWMADHFTGVPHFLTSESLVPHGALLQATHEFFQNSGVDYVPPGSARHAEVQMRARVLHDMPSSKTTADAITASDAAQTWWNRYNAGGRFTPDGALKLSTTPDVFESQLPTAWLARTPVQIDGHAQGPVPVGEIFDNFDQVLGHDAAQSRFYPEVASGMIGLVDALDDHSVSLALGHFPGAEIGDNMRNELAARLTAAFGSQQQRTPLHALDFVLKSLDEISRGARNGTRTGRLGAQRTMDAIIRNVGGRAKLGDNPRAYDFMDSLLGRRERSVTGGTDLMQPAPLDAFAMRSLGFDRTAAESPTPFQYEWAVHRINEEMQWANMNDWHGHSDWTAADIADLHSSHMRKLDGQDIATPGDLLASKTVMLSTVSVPAKGALLNDLTGGSIYRVHDELPARKVGTATTGWQGTQKPLPFEPEAAELIHHDMIASFRPILQRETGVSLLGEFYGATEGDVKGGAVPQTGWKITGSDAQINDALNATAHYFQQNELLATDLNVPAGVTAADPANGVHWAIDFTPTDVSPATLNALSRYILDKHGVDVDHVVLGLNADGGVTVRALWRKGTSGADQRAFETAMPVYPALHNKLTRGDWVNQSLAMPGQSIPVTTERRLVRVQSTANTDQTLEGVADDFYTNHPMTSDMAHEMEALQDRIKAFRTGGTDRASYGQSQRQAYMQLENRLPGDRGQAGNFFIDTHRSILDFGASPTGAPNEVVIVRRPGYQNRGAIGVRDATGQHFLHAMTVEFDHDAVSHIGYTGVNPDPNVTGGFNKGVGTYVYDLLSDTHPELEMYRAVGGGSYSDIGGIYAHDWLVHRYETLAARRDRFDTWAWQNERARQRFGTNEFGNNPANVGKTLNDVRAEEQGKPYLDKLRSAGRADTAARLADEHSVSAYHALDDAVRRHAPQQYAVNRHWGQSSARWDSNRVVEPTGASAVGATGVPGGVPNVGASAAAVAPRSAAARAAAPRTRSAVLDEQLALYNDYLVRNGGTPIQPGSHNEDQFRYSVGTDIDEHIANVGSLPPADWDPYGYRPSGGTTHYQRGPLGVRGATTWNARREATHYYLNSADATTPIHEAFHVFAEELDPSAKRALAEQYHAEYAQAARGAIRARRKAEPVPPWSVDVEEWAAKKFEQFAADPGSVADPTLAANLHAFANYSENVLGLPKATVHPDVAAAFNSILTRDHTPAVLFNLDEQRIWEASRVALLREEDQAHRTHFYARGRNWVERSLNHPYLGLYPLSYMWGKVVPEMVRFLVKRPFGLKAPFGGLAMAKDVWLSTQLQMQTDPELRKFVDEHPNLTQYISLLLPGTPWEAPVNMPVVARRAIQNYIDNQERAAKGQEPANFDLASSINDMIAYSIGLAHFTGQITQLLNPSGGSKTSGLSGVAPQNFVPGLPQ